MPARSHLEKNGHWVEAASTRETSLAIREENLFLRSSGEVVGVLETVIAAMSKQGFSDRDRFGLRLALEEALVNAIKHGHRYDPSKQVRVRYRVSANRALVRVEDQGPGFDPNLVGDPLSPEGLERSSGRGLLLMNHYTTWVRYNKRGNRVTLCKQKQADKSPR